MYTFPGNILADEGTEDEQRAEMTIKERLAQLGEEMVVKVASSQLRREADSAGNNSLTELNLATNARSGRSIFRSDGDCCQYV